MFGSKALDKQPRTVMKEIGLLVWVFFIHLVGIYLFTRGFLLTRLSLSEITDCSLGPCTLPPTHNRAVILIIDALRFDFLTLHPPDPQSQFHHNVLTLPRELTALHPDHSLLFNAYADPPTTTLQRIKGLTTGSLPSFVEIGSNFGGSSILEDSILNQLQKAGQRVSALVFYCHSNDNERRIKAAFMGDDTWMTAFPDTFQANMSFPYDSFNVEDLHTVDEGVIRHLLPLLLDSNKPFDFLIGHFLGVDHVGHRLGPDHPSMKAKLEQMNQVLRGVVELLDDDTLLVVLGDHGMDKTGDHGGDGELETSSGLWIYSKGPPIAPNISLIPSHLLPTSLFPGTSIPHRTIQQIDLVPSLSLLLGLPVPFNNLGTVIPELFWRDRDGTDFVHALDITAAQIKKYLDVYRASVSGSELDGTWPELQSSWAAIEAIENPGVERMFALNQFNRFALATCRSMWAQFNPLLMGFGLILLAFGLLATWALYSSLPRTANTSEAWLGVNLRRGLRGFAGGTVLGFVLYLTLESSLTGIDALDCVLFAGPFLSSVVITFSALPGISISALNFVLAPVVLHILTFLSNSFTIWEDHIITFLLLSSMIPFVLTGFTAPNARLRRRILGFSLLFAVCVRLIAISTVCREEQQSYCHITFFASSSLPTPPAYVLLLAVPNALVLPSVIQYFLGISKSDRGVAKAFLPWILRPALLAGSLYWIMEWADSASILGAEWAATLRSTRTTTAQLAMGVAVVGGMMLWWPTPMCMDIHVETLPKTTDSEDKKQVTLVGFANALGSPYLIFWSIFYSLVYATTQLTGQLVLSLGVVALLAYLEVMDSTRDSKSSDAQTNSPDVSTIQFAEIIPLALLGLHVFHGTGHQSVISTIQWKSAFLLTPTLTYPFSAMTVVINSIGSQFLVGLAAPLLAMWNRAPHVSNSLSTLKANQLDGNIMRRESVLAALGMMMYYASLLLGSAVSVAMLRRHLMVWKVFAPRFLSAILGLLVVDLGVLIGVGIGVTRIGKTVGSMFGGKRKVDLS